MLRVKGNIDTDVLVKKYGFAKKIISEELNLYEFELTEKYSVTLVQRRDRSIFSVIPGAWDTDCTPISDVVYKMIKDGLVEME